MPRTLFATAIAVVMMAVVAAAVPANAGLFAVQDKQAPSLHEVLHDTVSHLRGLRSGLEPLRNAAANRRDSKPGTNGGADDALNRPPVVASAVHHPRERAKHARRVFVGMLCRHECSQQVAALYSKASYPDDVFFGVASQFVNETVPKLAEQCVAKSAPLCVTDQLRTRRVDDPNAIAVTSTLGMWRDEPFILLLEGDSLEVSPAWDDVLRQERAKQRATHRRVVISYPSGAHALPTVPCAVKFTDAPLPSVTSDMVPAGKTVRTPFVSPGLIFGVANDIHHLRFAPVGTSSLVRLWDASITVAEAGMHAFAPASIPIKYGIDGPHDEAPVVLQGPVTLASLRQHLEDGARASKPLAGFLATLAVDLVAKADKAAEDPLNKRCHVL